MLKEPPPNKSADAKASFLTKALFFIFLSIHSLSILLKN
jgi:hypothetical protein